MGERILIVGCGGLGCELVKILSKDCTNDLTLVDDDTVDATNLNRQFLFTKDDIGKSKSEIVARKIEPLMKAGNPDARIFAIFDRINEFPQIDFYRKFDVVYNCLDNNETRSFVNQRCHAAGVPMVDGGSAGWLGQSFYNQGECFDCLPKQQEKVYPVCSIRQRPTDFKHCLIWGQSVVEENDTANIEQELSEHAMLSIDSNPKHSEKVDANESMNSESSIEVVDQESGDLATESLKISISTDSESSIEVVDQEGDDLATESLKRSISTDSEPKKKKLKISDKPTSSILTMADIEMRFKSSEDKTSLIYKLALLKASRFNIEPLSLMDSQTVLNKIIPSICATNSIIASLMALSRSTGRNYYLVQGSLGIIKTAPNKKREGCLTCSLPVYECLFPEKTRISEFFTTFRADSLISDNASYDLKSDEGLEALNKNFAVTSKNGFLYRIYFESGAKELTVKRIR